MRSLVKLLIEEEGIRRTPSIYISILLAYLEEYNWQEAANIITIIESLELLLEEKQAYLYLKALLQEQSETAIEALCQYLYH